MATNKEKLIAGAQKLVEKGQFEKAIKEYLKVVAADDKDVRIWLKIGDLYAKLGQKQEAAETYQKVAEFYSDQGFYLKSVAVYKQIVKLDPRLVDVNQRLAELYKQLGLLSDAMAQYEAVAAFYHKEGKSREALAALKQIVELDPETVVNRIKLAELYSKEQMPREAIDEFTKAAEQLKSAGRTDDYMKVAERLLFHSPDNRPVSKELAKLYIEKGDPRRALPKLQVCFKADPRDAEVLHCLAKAFEALEQRPKAVSVLKELARILGENGDRPAQEEVYRKILALAPNDADAEAALTRARAGSRAAPLERTGLTGRMPVVPFTTGTHAIVPSSEGDAPIDDGDMAGDENLPVTRSGPRPAYSGGEGGAGTEQITRILNETDVYIKYRLYGKAVEHVQRVFEYDPNHIEAREKLKALYLSLGKREEAVLELWALVERAEEGRQRRYLREILELDPSNAKAAGMLGTEAEAPQPARSGDSAELVDVTDLEELPDEEFDIAEVSGHGTAEDRLSLDGEDDLIPVVVEPIREEASESSDEVEDRFGLGDSDEEPDNRFGFAEESSEESTGARTGAGSIAASDSQPQDVSTGVHIAPAASRGGEEEEGSDVHTRFDDQAVKFLQNQALLGGSGEVNEDELPSLDDLPRSLDVETGPVIDEGMMTPLSPIAAAAAREVTATVVSEQVSFEDDLDEADFFMQQSLFDEARTILQNLIARHPAQPLVSAKLRDLEAMEHAAQGESTRAEAVETAIEEVAAFSAELPDDLPGSSEAAPLIDPQSSEPPPVMEMTRRGVIEKGVTAEDYETHYDLGIAYKEMGLIDDAIAEFRVVMNDRTREVQCQLMIGLCCLEKGQQTDAIAYFKKALYVEGITDQESMSIYFELGQAYERLGDQREALYYYDKVFKRDPRFRGVDKLVEALRKSGTTAAGETLDDETGEAFDSLLDSSGRRG